ncbi:MAG: hypothetical protein KF777_13735 [Planctomycetaceae bacterium]|nr:hypothetical protein [Planctomycetaceae bacterium]
MDVEAERFRAFLCFLAVVAVCISGYHTVRDARYFLVGKTAVGRVTNVRETIDASSRRPRRMLRADYEFADSTGKAVAAHEQLPLGFPITIDERVTLEYLSGVNNSARLTGRQNWLAIIVFVGSLLAIAGGLTWLIREANRPITARSRFDDDDP